MIPVLLERDDALPLVHVSVAFRLGSIADPPGKEGLTSLTLRLMRRTGGGRDPRAQDERIDSLGAALWVDAGQSTAGAHGSVISRSLPAFLAVMREVIAEPGFDPGELERLRREAESELTEVLDSDRSLARRWFARRLFAGHPYGRPTGGTRASLAAITLDDIHARYRELVVASNITLAFAGDIELATARAFADELARALPAGPALHDPTEDPTQRPGIHLSFVDKPERTQTQILIGCLGTHPLDPDHLALSVANTVFGGTFTSRLTQEVRAKRGWSYGAYSSLAVDRRRRSFSMWTFPKLEDALSCIQLELDLLRAWVKEGPTEEELESTKSYLARSHAFSTDSAAKRVSQQLDAALYDLPASYYSEYTAKVPKVTLAEARASLARLTPDKLRITVVGTASSLLDQLEAGLPLDSSERIPFDAD
ncbi:MAG: insulinase family protein [Polyangiaceae bacterium]|nr:insulinase family protein [Polyangiaceae bacterium]MCW5790841.1 insulinase family protein [Polyangiaceae bacterium]